MNTQLQEKPKNFSLSAFVKLTRLPNLLIIALAQYLTALCLVHPPAGIRAQALDFRLFLLVLSTVMVAAAGYIINDYYDVKIDYINRPERVIIGRRLKRRIAMAWHIVLNSTGLLISLYLGLKIAMVNALAIFLLWLYSNQLKRLPFVGNFTVSLLIGMAISIVGLFYQIDDPILYTYAVFAFGINLIREILKDLEDLRGDLAFGCKTLPIVWGIRKTKRFLYVLTIGFASALFLFTSRIDHPTLTVYFFSLLVPVGYLLILLFQADRKLHYARLSFFCKMIMLGGLISMIFF